MIRMRGAASGQAVVVAHGTSRDGIIRRANEKAARHAKGGTWDEPQVRVRLAGQPMAATVTSPTLLRVERVLQNREANALYDWNAALLRQDKRGLERLLSPAAEGEQQQEEAVRPLGPCCQLLTPLASVQSAWQRVLCSLPLPLPNDYCTI